MSHKLINIIVNGYIRRQKDILSNSNEIPNDVINICCMFYSNGLKIFIHFRKNTELFHIYDINTRKISKLSTYTKLRSCTSSLCFPFCYVNNISSYLKIPSRCNGLDININSNIFYDGIIGFQKKEFGSMHRKKEQYNPCIMIFETNKIGDKKLKYHRFFSTQSMQRTLLTFEQFIFCESNGIIHEYDGYLYQMKLSTIDLNHFTPNFHFKMINKANPFWTKPKLGGYLSMAYMRNYSQIFAIGVCQFTQLPTMQCKIFNFGNNKWKSVKSFDQMAAGNTYIPLHNVYDTNIVYAISNDGNIWQFDMDKNKWNTILMITNEWAKLDMGSSFLLWMDNKHVLCCSDGYYFRYCDLRKKNKTWCAMNVPNSVKQHSKFVDPTVFL